MTAWMSGLWVVVLVAALLGTGGVTLTLIPWVPETWTRHHFRLRRPGAAVLSALAVGLAAGAVGPGGASLGAALVPLLLTAFFSVLAVRLHQEFAFPAVDFPPASPDPLALPLADDQLLAVLEVEGVTRAYPLDYVIHHHVVNDRFGDRMVALTYCAMCRTVVPVDVTALGPLFVGSFKHANMIVADRRTHTFFQQGSLSSLIGPLHPMELEMLWCQTLTWADVKQLDPLPQVVAVTERDLRAFELPIPGVWKHIVASERTPGLFASQRDTTRSARTRVVGVVDPAFPARAWVRDELLAAGGVHTDEVALLPVGEAVVAFRRRVGDEVVTLSVAGTVLVDDTGRRWDVLGRALGDHPGLVPVATSDEYWFSWRFWRPGAPVG
mgnify:CR=1 FL=1